MALYFIHNDTPELSSSTVILILVKYKIYNVTPLFRAMLGRYLQGKFEVLKKTTKQNNNKKQKQNRRAVKLNMLECVSEHVQKNRKKERK